MMITVSIEGHERFIGPVSNDAPMDVDHPREGPTVIQITLALACVLARKLD
jgi:hypothetical protein